MHSNVCDFTISAAASSEPTAAGSKRIFLRGHERGPNIIFHLPGHLSNFANDGWIDSPLVGVGGEAAGIPEWIFEFFPIPEAH